MVRNERGPGPGILSPDWPDQPGLRWIFYQDLRRDELCDSLRDCTDAKGFTCRDCGESYESDPDFVDPCPACGSRQYRRDRCEECPISKLQLAIAESAVSGRYHAAVNLDAALQMGFRVDYENIDAQSFEDIRVLNIEKARHQQQKQRAQETHRQDR